jgi:phenylpyruvate tautomerase PptA (4-oxalocrotonate tautomerase family)
MPFIQCDIEHGLSDTQKSELLHRIAAVTNEAIGSSYKDINVILREHSTSNMLEGGAAPD